MTRLRHEFSWKFPAPPARVFAALTEPKELEAWFAERVEVEPRVGGAFRFWGRHTLGAPTRAEATQTLTRYEPDQAIGFSWRLHDRDSEVMIEIAPDPDNESGAAVKGAHAFETAPAINRAREMIDDMWRLHWGNLNAHLMGGKGKLRPDFTSETADIRLSIFIDAPPEAVFRTLIDPEKVAAWFGCPAAVDAHAGGTFHLQMSVEVGGEKKESPPMRILEFVENERLALEWPDWRLDKNVPHQRVVWTLKREGAGTRLSLLHDGFVRTVDMSDYPFGWGYFLGRIKDVTEGNAIAAAKHA